jgi:hypothetical protein
VRVADIEAPIAGVAQTLGRDRAGLPKASPALWRTIRL